VNHQPWNSKQVNVNPSEVRNLVIEHNNLTNRARILIGYCWNWPVEGRKNTNYHDIKIDDFEIDYVGVIIGDDIRYENGHIITDFRKRAKTDNSLKGIKKLYKENPVKAEEKADEIIKNTYRTLLTRGMKGCCIYCTDPGLREYIKNKLNHK
jgi:hypothetical protein